LNVDFWPITDVWLDVHPHSYAKRIHEMQESSLGRQIKFVSTKPAPAVIITKGAMPIKAVMKPKFG